MNAFDKAQKEAERLKKETKKKDADAKKAAIIESENENHRQKLINETLDSFNDKCGIKRQGNSLWKKKNRIATMNTRWEEWENPNYDYSVRESGVVIHWEVFDATGNIIIMTGSDIDSFAEYMAQHLL